jgi:phosphatidylserine decarboxylase
MIWHRWYGYGVYHLAHCRWKYLAHRLIRLWCWHYGVSLKDALKPCVYDYNTLADFFSRRVHPKARPFAHDAALGIVPCDGIWLVGGAVHQQHLSIKHSKCSMSDLLQVAQPMRYYGIIYLAPFHYHRVYAPMDGHVVSVTYVPGRCDTVNPCCANANTYLRNERLIIHLTHLKQHVYVVMVGALGVSWMTTPWTKRLKKAQCVNIGCLVQKGDELGTFGLGSTVVLATDAHVAWHHTDTAPICLGQPLFTFCA